MERRVGYSLVVNRLFFRQFPKKEGLSIVSALSVLLRGWIVQLFQEAHRHRLSVAYLHPRACRNRRCYSVSDNEAVVDLL